MRIQPLRGIVIAALCAGLLAACGSSRPAATTDGAEPAATQTVDIYSSLPLRGPRKAESEAIVKGINVALLQYPNDHVGPYQVRYRSLDDTRPRSGGWSMVQTVANAQKAAGEPHAVAYIGDLDSGATKLSLPILNQADIVQITPGSGYPGLTNSVRPVTRPGEPQVFYPNRNSRTLLRLIPNDLVEAAAALDELKSLGCMHVAAASLGGGTDGAAFVRAIAATVKLYGMVYVPSPKGGPGTNPKLYPAYAEAMRNLNVGCFVLTGHDTQAATAVTKAIHAELPAGYIVGTSGFCNRSWLGTGANAIPAADQRFLLCTSPVLPLSKYPGYRPFMTNFHKLYGKNAKPPGPYAVYGYQAAEMVLNVLVGLESGGDIRRQVLEGVTDGGVRNSALVGSYVFDPFGNLVSRKYPLYTFKDGQLVYSATLNPPYVLQ